MATFVLIHGAADTAWYWHLVAPEVRERGHDVVMMDLPCDDDSAGLSEYAETMATFMHEVAPDLAAEALRRVRDQSVTPGREPWPLEAWPDGPTRFLLCRDDRLFAAEWMRRVVKERLGVTPMRSMGVTASLSQPAEGIGGPLEAYLSDRLVRATPWKEGVLRWTRKE